MQNDLTVSWPRRTRDKALSLFCEAREHESRKDQKATLRAQSLRNVKVSNVYAD